MTCIDAKLQLEHVEAVERVLRLWLADDDLTLFCGAWSNGAIMELLPQGRARLTGPLYEGQFAGLRDLLLDDGGHHVHLDLGRLCRVVYIVAPSVCYGFRPSFELRIVAPGADPLRAFGLGLALRHPYTGDGLCASAVRRYFSRVAAHLEAHPEVVSLSIRGRRQGTNASDWAAIEQVLASDPALRPLQPHLARAEAH